jgi:hypothetical protein
MEFDFSHEIVKQKLKERYGNNIPFEGIVVSPAQIFNSNILMIVQQN